jgi:hypothetical protein
VDAAEVDTLCEELRDLIKLGPGVNDDALRRARGIIETFRATRSGDYVNEKLIELAEGFEQWFSARNWDINFDAGASCKQWLYVDIGGLGYAMAAWRSSRREGKA